MERSPVRGALRDLARRMREAERLIAELQRRVDSETSARIAMARRLEMRSTEDHEIRRTVDRLWRAFYG